MEGVISKHLSARVNMILLHTLLGVAAVGAAHTISNDRGVSATIDATGALTWFGDGTKATALAISQVGSIRQILVNHEVVTLALVAIGPDALLAASLHDVPAGRSPPPWTWC